MTESALTEEMYFIRKKSAQNINKMYFSLVGRPLKYPKSKASHPRSTVGGLNDLGSVKMQLILQIYSSG